MPDHAMLWDTMVWYGMAWYSMVWHGKDYILYGRDNADSLALQICRLVVLCLMFLSGGLANKVYCLLPNEDATHVVLYTGQPCSCLNRACTC